MHEHTKNIEASDDTEMHRPGVLARAMRTARRTPRRGLLIGGAVVVLVVGLVVGILGTASRSPNANAQPIERPHASPNRALETQGWTLYNHSTDTIQYTGYTGNNGGYLDGGGPASGTQIPPGGQMNFQQAFVYKADWSSTSVDLNFEDISVSSQGTFGFTLTDTSFNQASASTIIDGFTFNISVDSDNRALNFNN